MKPFSYFFVLLVLLGAGCVMAQNVSATDSLTLPTMADTLTVSASVVGDTLAVDSALIKPAKEPPFKARVKYKAADSIKINIANRRVYMYKETQVNYEDIELTAFKTEFDMTSKIVYAKGGRDSANMYMEAPVFKQGGTDYEADSLSYNFDTKKGIIHRIKTAQGEGHLQATKSKRYADGHIDLGGGIYTTCDADHPHFGLRLSKGKVIPGDKVVFGPAYLVLLDIPIYPLMLPFGFFPQTDKQAMSGIIPPSIGMEISRGLSLTRGGYYFAFNDNIDAQIMGDVYSSGTWRSELLTRYLKRYKFSGDMNFSYGVTVSGEKGLDRSNTKQYSIQWSHRQDAKANPNHTFQASVNYSSSSYDKEYNYVDNNAYFTNTKTSSVSYTQKWPNSPFSFSTNMRANQSSSTNGSTTIDFPNFNFRMDRIYPFRPKEPSGVAKWYEDISLQYDASMQNTLEGNEQDLFSERNLKNMRNGFQHKIPFSINFKALKFFNITPSLNYSGVLYTSRIHKTFQENARDSTSQRGIVLVDTIRGLSYAHALSPSLSVSMNPKFYLTNDYSSNPNSKVQAIRTVVSPTVGISFVPDLSRFFDYYETVQDRDGVEREYSIYEHQRLYGTPTSPGKSGSVTLGMNGNVEMKVRALGEDSVMTTKKVKLINNISANTTYNMFADSMKFNTISLSANTTVLGLNLTLSGSADPYQLTPAGSRINQLGMPRLTSMTFNTGITLPLQKEQTKTEAEKDETKSDYTYFDVPWNLTISYGLNYSKPQFESRITQTLNFSGNVTLTPKWSLNFQSTYDFEAKKIAYTTASIQRDLHCWQMSFNFSPFGVNKYYFFQINVKSSTLKDLKYEKRKSASDFSATAW